MELEIYQTIFENDIGIPRITYYSYDEINWYNSLNALYNSNTNTQKRNTILDK